MKKKKNLLILGIFTIIVLITGCGRDRTLLQTDQTILIKPKGKIKYNYIIKPNDRVAITLYKYQNLTPQNISEKGILVDSNGYISLPLIHKVHIAGLTENQATNLLEKKFSKYLKDPTLNLEIINKRAYILGEVKKPGPVPIDRGKTNIFEAIAVGEGLTTDALRDDILVLSHDSKGNLQLRRIDLSNYHNLALSNITIKPDDIIYIPPSGWKEFRINSQNFTSIFKTIADIASPFVTMKYLFKD